MTTKNNSYFAALVSNVGLLYVSRNYVAFVNAMAATIQHYLSEAFYLGASGCGIAPNEITAEEAQVLSEIIQNEFAYLSGLSVAIFEIREAGYPISALYARLEVWTNRYLDVINRAQTLVCGDQKLKWVLGPTDEHCSSCASLDGKVKRASQWEQADLHPQHPPNSKLDCGGWRCLCTLELTDEPLTPGPLPYL